MAGRTTFVIAHRLSTISLADEIVVLEDGRLVAHGTHDELLERPTLYREIVEKGLPDQVFLNRASRSSARWRGCDRGHEVAREATRRDDLRRRLRGTSGRGRKLRGLLVLLRPYRARVIAHVRRAGRGDRGVAGPGAAGQVAIDDGIVKGDLGTLDLVVLAFIVSALVFWGASYAQTYLVGWVGQRALQDLRLQIFGHLQEMPVGFYERRPAGVLISRMTNDVEALDSLVTDSVVTLFSASLTLIGTVVDPALPRRAARAADVPHLPGDGARLARLPRSPRADAYRRTRETIGAITAYLQESLSGIRVVRAFGQEPRHVAPLPPSSTRSTATRT